MLLARRVFRLGTLCCAWGMLCTLPSLAQHGGGGGGMPGGNGPGQPSGGGGNFSNGGNFGPGSYNHGGPPPNNLPDSAGTPSTMRGGLQLGPPGRWWDDKHFAKDLRLRPDQQHRMDNIFEANRGALTRRLDDLHQTENRLDALVHTHAPDEAALDAAIDRRSQAHAELEKAYTHYLLLLRSEMDADQISRLEEHR